jgi:hypothetical protein
VFDRFDFIVPGRLQHIQALVADGVVEGRQINRANAATRPARLGRRHVRTLTPRAMRHGSSLLTSVVFSEPLQHASQMMRIPVLKHGTLHHARAPSD